jgi:deoxyribodipyrimidine photo-lyase
MAPVIFWFRRDLRITDHLGLATALATGEQVLPVYVVDPAMNPGGDVPATRTVLWRALQALDATLQAHGSRLICRRGDATVIIPALVRTIGAAAVYATRKQGALFAARDEKVAAALAMLGVAWHMIEDDTLAPFAALHKESGGYYSVFTPFSKQLLAYLKEHEPARVVVPSQRLRLAEELRALPGTVAEAFGEEGPEADRRLPSFAVSTAAAETRLAQFTGVGAATSPDPAPLLRYHQQRDLPGIDGTARLSPHLAWGTLSIRAAYLAALAAARAADAEGREGCRVWVNELAWREFYHHILFHAPYAETEAYQRPFAAMTWEGDEADFDRWCAGQTGYPIVDAGMRQLNQTGWLHNRVRMIVASFLTKDLLLDWQMGERYFMQRLIDLDLASNNGGWQWSASTGTDASPYFRIFNPTTQGERYDPDGAYVRQWVPELARVPTTALHAPWKLSSAERQALCPNYPPPLVDHAERRPRAIAMYDRARGKAHP